MLQIPIGDERSKLTPASSDGSLPIVTPDRTYAPSTSCCVWNVSAEACSMQRMSSFRQQTHYELLGLSFLVSGLSGNLPFLVPLELLALFAR